jgi:hypothetical protein
MELNEIEWNKMEYNIIEWNRMEDNGSGMEWNYLEICSLLPDLLYSCLDQF